MQAISNSGAPVEFEIFTTVPSWFFEDSLSATYTCHRLVTDIGLVQKSAFRADLSKTLSCLNDFLPFSAALISEISTAIHKLNCILVISDISPLGLAMAKNAAIPSVLVENFTWDWIYQQYVDIDDRFKAHIAYLKILFEAADYHIKTKPMCQPGPADLTTFPVSREIKTPAGRIRKQLGIPTTARMVLITTGGIKQSYGFLKKLKHLPEIHFVLPGAGPKMVTRNNCTILPHRSNFYHPDLINASDAVVGKVGYSTLAEVYQAGVPFGYVVRSNFRESGPMATFIEKKMQGIAMDESEFSSGSWATKLEDLLNLKRRRRRMKNGADQIGRFIREHILQNPHERWRRPKKQPV